MDYSKEVGARLKKARGAKALSLREVESLTAGAISNTRLSNYENGYRMLGQAEAVLLGKIYNTRPAYLLAVDDIQTPITKQEETLIRNWRTLAERDRMGIFRKLETMALTSRDPVSDAHVGKHITQVPERQSGNVST